MNEKKKQGISFKDDLQDGFRINAETGIWFLFGSGLFLSLLVMVVSSMTLYQNTNFQSDDPFDTVMVWTVAVTGSLGSLALLLFPWLLFKSTTISLIVFLFLFLILCLVSICMLGLSQSQFIDASQTFETAIFWSSILILFIAIGCVIGLSVLIWSLSEKQNKKNYLEEMSRQIIKTTKTTRTTQQNIKNPNIYATNFKQPSTKTPPPIPKRTPSSKTPSSKTPPPIPQRPTDTSSSSTTTTTTTTSNIQQQPQQLNPNPYDTQNPYIPLSPSSITTFDELNESQTTMRNINE